MFLVVLYLLVTAVSGGNGWITFDSLHRQPYTVSYTERSLTINGAPSLFISGSLHYPRFTPDKWMDIIQLAKENGLNMIEIYVFWNYHEQVEGQINWEGNADLYGFVDMIGKAGLFVNLRVGPYVCAEWDYGGIPYWLGLKEGIQFRCSNPVWMSYMEAWFRTVVSYLAPQFAAHGGPIMLVQVENEYYFDDWAYVQWCGEMAEQVLTELNIYVPVTMCNGNSANNTINTCNGEQDGVVTWLEENGQNGKVQISQPALWTENEGGFQVWGEGPETPTSYFWGQSSQAMAYSILRWFARGGSHMNYYMYYGGNHLSHWAGASVTTMYAADNNICPDGLPHEPKFSHLGALHYSIASYASVLVNSPSQLRAAVNLSYFDNSTNKFEPGTQQLAFIYGSGKSALIFLENSAPVWVTVQFNYEGQQLTYDMSNQSVVLVDGATLKVVYNTGEVPQPDYHRYDRPVELTSTWRAWSEPLELGEFPTVNASTPGEQISLTNDQSQYMYYQTSFTAASSGTAMLALETQVASSFIVFVDDAYVGNMFNTLHDQVLPGVPETLNIAVTAGTHTLTLLSESLGVANFPMTAGGTAYTAGITGQIFLGETNLTAAGWTMRPLLAGELLNVSSWAGAKAVSWGPAQPEQPVTWYQTEFSGTEFSHDELILLNITGLNRGHFYVNGVDLGRYWSLQENNGSGQATQTLYYIPWWFVHEGQNLLTIFEAVGGDPRQITLVGRSLVELFSCPIIFLVDLSSLTFQRNGPPPINTATPIIHTCPM